MSTFQESMGPIQLLPRPSLVESSNEILYDVLTQGASKLPEVKVKSSKKLPFYQVSYTSLNH